MITKKKFYAYRKVQMEGRYNMLTDEARISTRLSEEDYKDILQNYQKYLKEYFDERLEDAIVKCVLKNQLKGN